MNREIITKFGNKALTETIATNRVYNEHIDDIPGLQYSYKTAIKDSLTVMDWLIEDLRTNPDIKKITIMLVIYGAKKHKKVQLEVPTLEKLSMQMTQETPPPEIFFIPNSLDVERSYKDTVFRTGINFIRTDINKIFDSRYIADIYQCSSPSYTQDILRFFDASGNFVD